MSPSGRDWLRLWEPMLGTVLDGVEGLLDGARRSLSLVDGRGSDDLEEDPPLDDLAGDLAEHLLRLSVRDPLDLPAATSALRAAARASLEGREWGAWWSLPLEWPAAFAGAGLRVARRALDVATVVPPEALPDFAAFAAELFTDLDVYFRLRYGEELDRWRQRLERRPRDGRARLELARTLIKCGLFREAAQELETVAAVAAAGGGDKLLRRALFERTVAKTLGADPTGAVEDGAACLRLDPSHDKARYWLWLASRKTAPFGAGDYPPEVEDSLRMEAVDGWAPCAVKLEEVSGRLGLDKVSGGRGTAVLDVDGNGWLDVVVAGAHAGCSLFRNNGDGTFRDTTVGSGLDRCLYGFSVVAGDYDNDGRPDLFVTSLGFYDGRGQLFHNEGDGTFTDVTGDAGIDCWGPGFTAAWADYDGDGRLDLFVANNLGGLFDRKTPNRLFHNEGDGTFREVAAEAGLGAAATSAPTLGVAWGDFSNNGRPDLFLSNFGRPQLFRNNGDGTFRDITREAGLDLPAIGSVALIWDVDDDGWLDIVQLTYSRPRDAIYTLRHGHGPPWGSPLRIFRNNRDGTFTNVAPELGVSGCWGTMSAALGDFDNDGFQDLWLGNGDPSMDRSEACVLLRNAQGPGKERGLENVSFSAGLPWTGKGHGMNMADLCGDGRLHLMVASGGLYPGDLQPSAVFRPKEVPGNYLNVRLRGTASNRDALGARLRLRAGGRDQHRLVSGGSGFGCLPAEQHFGLGTLTAVEDLEIRWPSGRQQRLTGLPVNAAVDVVEGQAGSKPRGGRR